MFSRMSYSIPARPNGVSQGKLSSFKYAYHEVPLRKQSLLARFDLSSSCFSIWVLGESSLDSIINIVIVVCSIVGQDLVHCWLVEDATDCPVICPAWDLEDSGVVEGRTRNLLWLS